MSYPAGHQDPSSPQPKARQRAGPPRTRATVRTSLACVPCRSKHTKCDGDLPACIRCRLENKVCSYAKSRRGARVRKAQDETTFGLPSDTSASPDSTALDSGLKVTKNLPGGWTSGPAPHPSQYQNYLLDQYYLYFHDSHPWLPPKTTMRRLIESRPDEVQFTTTMMVYIGSVYSNVDTDPLRQRAFQMASGPLSNSVWDVQALLSLSLAACGEGHIDLCGSFFNTALEIALGLGLQNKSFAATEEDPVLAESYRRTYWALYFHGSIRTVREHLGYFRLFSTSVTTELPCDEWDYQTGHIPTPVSLQEYERNPLAGTYSSWTYLVGLMRISGESVVPILNVGSEANPDAIESANYRVEAWFQQLPHWKQHFVDESGAVDMVLYHALGIAYGLQIRIQLHLCGIGVNFGVSDLVKERPAFQFPSPPPSAGLKWQPWLHGSTALSAALGLAGLFKFRLPPEKFSPSCTLGMERAVLPLLDAYLDQGQQAWLLRDKIVLLASVVGKAGEFWPLAQNVSKDIFRALETADQSLGSQPMGEYLAHDQSIDWLALEVDEGEGLGHSQPWLTQQTKETPMEMPGTSMVPDYGQPRGDVKFKVEDDGSGDVPW